MSDSSSKTFQTLPIESGEIGETMSLPTVEDYLKQICKEDDINAEEYIAKANEIKTIDKPILPRCRSVRSIQQDALLNPKMTYTFVDRLKSIWIAIKNLRYTSYDIFDFNKYDEVDGGWEYLRYTKTSTPWNRLKRFLKTQFREIKWAWDYTPEHIKHYNKNKERVDYFEDHNVDYFFGDEKSSKEAKLSLQNFGYTVHPDSVYYAPIKKDDKITFEIETK